METASSSEAATQDVAAHLFSPYEHIASLSSKNVRARIADAFNTWLHLPSTAIDAVKGVIDKLHNASLLVDDIEDSSVLRRGAPTAHQLFGMPLTLNCANHVYFMALTDVLGLVPALLAGSEKENCDDQTLWHHYRTNEKHLTLELAGIFASELVELHEGQGMDILWRDSFTCPSLEQYDSMVLKKTGGLFRLALRMMLALAPPATMPPAFSSLKDRAEKLERLVNTIGVFFQTLDDLLNVTNVEYHQSKSFCDDLTEGKFSYPVIHCILESRTKGDHRLFHIIRQRPRDNDVKAFAVRLMHESGSVAACRRRVEDLRASVVDQVGAIGGCPPLMAAVNTLVSMMN
jgi:geranylgeranyl diphosphate synthase type 3